MSRLLLAAFLSLATPMAMAQTTDSSAGPLRVERLADGLNYPWGLAILPDGSVVVTQKPGSLRIFSQGKLSAPVEVAGVSWRGQGNDQGGLLDVAVDPDFATTNRIYLSFSEATPDNATGEVDRRERRFGGALSAADNLIRGGSVASAILKDGRLQDLKVIWRQTPKQVGRGHFGHRMIFGPGGRLFIASGDRMRFDPAQDLSSNLGKIVRINRDGSIPGDNPFAGKGGAEDVWSLGHRNILALAFEPDSDRLWAFEMGPQGGDEMNLIQPGRNYGWPLVSDGVNYDGSPIPKSATRQEFEKPLKTWTPVIAPSGALVYSGAMFPWKGKVLVGGLRSMGLVRITLNNGAPVNEERISLGKRIRAIAQAPDGALLVITDDARGELLRLTPQKN